MPRACGQRGCGLPAHKGFRFCAGPQCSMRHKLRAEARMKRHAKLEEEE